MLPFGLYEQVVNLALRDELEEVPKERKALMPMDSAESSKVVSLYMTDIIKRGLDDVGTLDSQILLANKIIDVITKETQQSDFAEYSIDARAEQLLALLAEKDPLLALGKNASFLQRPETSVAQSSLFTGAIHEPQMVNEIKKEIVSADRIDMLVSFIKWSGLRLIIDDLKTFVNRGGHLRIITTSYMGATDMKAIEVLSSLMNTQIKVSYDTKCTRLHAKAYVFYRSTGFTTAYVGSSNMSNAALSSGLEWNMKVTRKDLPETIQKITATFESYWNDNGFETYTERDNLRLMKALKAEKYREANDGEKYLLDITPYAYQQEILDRLEAERTVRGYTHNLLVAATGTGKTVISAFDYKRYCKNHPEAPARLLFIAHREEILRQSLYTFRAIMKDANFGELFVGHHRPESIGHLFMSIQTFNSQDFTSKTSKDYYDFIVVDEFHHAAAPTYQRLLSYYEPKILLGLTATPERMDGKSILTYFDNRIAAEIRLTEAIERKLLCPFQYFGVSDIVDLSELKWTRGGYDKNELSTLYSFSNGVARKRADWIVQSLLKYVTDINDVKGLGFCVSVDHARFMSEFFNERGIPAMMLSGQSPDEERLHAQKQLINGEIRFIFVVDLYNEGVDIPEVNTILFLRPTESLTIFLQQLGRGLRLSEGKECLTVLDFIGQANKKYNFEDKFQALLSHTNRSVAREIKEGFVTVPKGCYIQLEKKAAQYILENINASYGRSAGLVARVSSFSEDTGYQLTLENFLNYYHLDARMLYRFSSFSRICVRAGVRDDFQESIEAIIEKALVKLCMIDSRRWIKFLLDFLSNIKNYSLESLSPLEQRMVQMFYVTVWGEVILDWEDPVVLERFHTLAESPVLLEEMIALLRLRFEAIDFIDRPATLGFDCPLDVHCTYTRDQILVALDFMKPKTVREGVKWLADKKIDVFFITLNKADKDYSPTTMYNDYSVSESLFHWQSQSTTSDVSKTGQRYINHVKEGSQVLLFVREFKKDHMTNIAEAYTYLGKACYVSHEGSRPMNIIWKLEEAIPAKFLKKTKKLVVG